jgi:hypothetical protein
MTWQVLHLARTEFAALATPMPLTELATLSRAGCLRMCYVPDDEWAPLSMAGIPAAARTRDMRKR